MLLTAVSRILDAGASTGGLGTQLDARIRLGPCREIDIFRPDEPGREE
jgi:hypothetical protein